MNRGPARLRLARQALGFSQQQLASRAGISRQAISAFESGVTDPSPRAALALARALSTTIGELFGTGNPAVPVAAAPVAPPGGPGARVTLAAMETGYVALPLRGAMAGQAGFLPASGLTAGTDRDRRKAGRKIRPLGPARPTLVAAGCDPALPLLAEPLSLLDPPVGFTWWPCPSQEALRLARRRARARRRGAPARPGQRLQHRRCRRTASGGGEVIGFCSWREGLALRPGRAGGISGVKDLAGAGCGW
jgi:DNA-binding XRE family transcriptional regulator